MATINSVFQTGALFYGERVMFETYNAEKYTFSQFASKVKDIQNTLYYYGVCKGSKVAILAEDTPQWNMAFYAIATMGAVAVQVSKHKDVSIIHRTTQAAECEYLLLQKGIIDEAVFAKMREDTHLTIIDIDTLKCVLSPNSKQKKSFQAHNNANSLTMPKVDISPSDIAAARVDIDYCSANVKYFTHEELVAEAEEQADELGLLAEDIIVSIMPISYSYRKFVSALISVMSGNITVFKPKNSNFKIILSLITDVKPTVIFTVPKVLELVYASSMVDEKSKALIEMNVEKIGVFDKMKLKLQGSKIYKMLGGKVRVCSLDNGSKSTNVERFLKHSGHIFKMKFN